MAGVEVEFSGVHLEFEPARPVLRNTNFIIAKGERVALIGPSGSGKSSLLKLSAGLIGPSRGEVFIRGKSWSAMTHVEKQILWQTTGMLFQKNALFDSISVAENVGFPLRQQGRLKEPEIKDRVNFFLESVGLLHVKDLSPDEISGGMQKRLGIARALALNPQTVFYDDPTAGLDPITSRSIVDLILRFQAESHSTVLAVTNDINRAAQLGQRILFVADGKVINLGTPKEAMANEEPVVWRFLRGLPDVVDTEVLC